MLLSSMAKRPPRPPLYPVPLYLCCNALLEVLEMWAKQTGRFAEGSPISVKVIGISMHACDIGAVLYGGCFLLTGTTHCLALATGNRSKNISCVARLPHFFFVAPRLLTIRNTCRAPVLMCAR